MKYAMSVGLNMIVAPLSFGAFMYFFAGSIFTRFFDGGEDLGGGSGVDVRRVIAGVVWGVFMLFVEMILFVIRSHELDVSVRKKGRRKENRANPLDIRRRAWRGFTWRRTEKRNLLRAYEGLSRADGAIATAVMTTTTFSSILYDRLHQIRETEAGSGTSSGGPSCRSVLSLALTLASDASSWDREFLRDCWESGWGATVDSTCGHCRLCFNANLLLVYSIISIMLFFV
ncbi:hypothetical protein ACHAWF_000410 [Thalassiosira exigua]